MTTASERRLIPPDDDDNDDDGNDYNNYNRNVHGPSSSSSTSNASVVGVIPPSVYDYLDRLRRTACTTTSSPHRTLLHGSIDHRGSGLSYLFCSGGDDDDDGPPSDASRTVFVWEHATHTPTEELLPPSRAWTLIHPEHVSRPSSSSSASHALPLHVTCLDRSSNPPSSSLRDVYLASPATGVICLWRLRRNDETDRARDCDASIRLPLEEGEVLTAMTPLCVDGAGAASGGSGSEWVVVATSRGRMWKMTKTARPLSLTAKAVKGRFLGDVRNGDGRGEEEGVDGATSASGGGFVSGWYNYIFTPSKKKAAERDDRKHDDDDSHDNSDGMGDTRRKQGQTHPPTEDGILALLPLPPPRDGRTAEIPSSSAAKTSPSQPSPLKRPRTSFSDSSPQARLLTLHPHLTLREYRISTTTAPRSTEREGYVIERHIAPRQEDGSFDVAEWGAAASPSSSSNESHERRYRNVDVVAPPRLTSDGRSVVLAVRVSNIVSEIVEERGADADARIYLLRISLDTYTVVDAAWLDRHSGESVSETGGSLVCAGLAVGDSDDGDGVGDDGHVGCGAVAYVAFGPPPSIAAGEGTTGGRVPVTVTAVHFSPLRSEEHRRAPHPAAPPRMRDMDLFEHLVPSLVADSVGYDSTTGGCLFASTAGLVGGAHVRFPPASEVRRGRTEGMPRPTLEGGLAREGDDDFEASFRDEAVLAIKSHLLSSFRQYLGRTRDEGANLAFVARSVAPPSIGSCAPAVLSAAVVLASLSMVNSANAGTDRMTTTTSAPPHNAMAALREKHRWHTDFVKFLLHAGAYRRVSATGRTKLRDHGEMIAAAGATLSECRRCLTKMDAEAEEGEQEVSAMRRAAMEALQGTSDVVADLPRRWDDLRRISGPDLEKESMMLTLSCVCRGLGEAFRYRANESSNLYDIPQHDPMSRGKGTIPWTSSREVLAVLHQQLENLQLFGDSVVSSSSNYEQDKLTLKRLVEDASVSLLAGYHDHFRCDPQDEELARLYDEAKRLAIPLLRTSFVNEDGDDLQALEMSLKHCFFEGIVQICHDHRRSWKFRGPFSPVPPDETFDIRLMLSGTSPESPYVHLHGSTDYRTGLPFCDFVLNWYADRGSNTEVRELGKECSEALTRFLRNDNRLADSAWIHDLRIGAHERAANTLVNLTSSIFPGKDAGGLMDLWEKEQMMSLAKLSNKLARSKNLDSALVAQNSTIIENSLNLIEAQRILQEDDLDNDESKAIIPPDELIVLAVNKINSSRDVVNIKKYGLCGLAIAHAISSEDANAMIQGAATIWEACIRSDIHTWNSLARENIMAVTGISEEDLSQRVRGTAFVGVNGEFATSSGGSMQGVGFLSNVHVRRRVLESLGFDEDLGTLLVHSAEMVGA